MKQSVEKKVKGPLVAGTLSETKAATTSWANQPSSELLEKMMKGQAVARHASLVKILENKLAIGKRKIKDAEKALADVQEKLKPADLPNDLETLTDEKRFLFRKIGLSMKTYSLIVRRVQPKEEGGNGRDGKGKVPVFFL
ncbi:hypothetical protein M9H77_35979 [Catharanthus roseus]|uniref:Uncharacterized protein n=1 Tax=Catharanthus roseus TaxID=4058 RepID=A0ACB9ZRH2_CATRO|nr:hypothetical protein M9H77_35979 [Catharanthus roseus]